MAQFTAGLGVFIEFWRYPNLSAENIAEFQVAVKDDITKS